MQRRSAKRRLRERGFALGPFIEARSPELIEILGEAGFDFVIIDREHAAFSGETTGEMIRAAAAGGIAPIVRVRTNSPGEILEALDLGAAGVHVPQVSNAADARRAVAAVRFPPVGERGFNPFVRAAGYGARTVEEFRREAEDDTLVVVHVEGAGALSGLDELLAVPGVDVAFLGPYDMSQTLGVPGEVTHAKVRETMRAIAAAAKPHGVAVGCFANSLEQAKVWLGHGVTYLAYSVDTQIFYQAARRIPGEIAGIREGLR